MKIIFVNRYYAPDHSATSQLLTDLATALARDHDVHVVTSRQRYGDAAASLPTRERIDGVAVHRVRATAFGRSNLPGRLLDYLSFYVAATFEVLTLARRGDVIVAMTDPPLMSIPARWAACIRGARLVNWLQDVYPEVAAALGVVTTRSLVGRILRGARTRSLRGAAASVVVGRAMQERVTSLEVDPSGIVFIPNWADGAALRPIAAGPHTLRAAWGLGDGLVVGYSGNFGRVHEFGTLLGAARTLRDRSDVAFLLVGDGAQMGALGAAVDEQQLSNVLFKPYQPRELLAQSLGAADVHIVSLRPELEGLVVPSKFYGIAAAGRPTIFIGDSQGEIGSLVRAAECGLCVRQGDVDGLVTAITTLRDDLALRERMGANARTLFERHFDRPIAVAAWRTLLDSVAAHS